MAKVIRIFGSSTEGETPFEYKSASVRGQAAGIKPKHIVWKHDGPLTATTFFTDGHIKSVDKFGAGPGRIAWLLEPRSLRPENYEVARAYADRFEYILTFDKELLEDLPNAKFYPFGGTSIPLDLWDMWDKTKDVCMFYSGKDTTEGHRMRTAIVETCGHMIDVYGEGVGKPVPNKFDVLKDYRFCIVVESCNKEYYFSEKLIDCYAVGTIPIYWGGFDYPDKIFFSFHVSFYNIEMMQRILGDIASGKLAYAPMMYLLERAKHFAVCEDWIYKRYPEVFE